MIKKRTEDFIFNRLITKDGLLVELPTSKDYMPRKIETIAGRTYEFQTEMLGSLIIPQTYKDVKLDSYSTVIVRIYRETSSFKEELQKHIDWLKAENAHLTKRIIDAEIEQSIVWQAGWDNCSRKRRDPDKRFTYAEWKQGRYKLDYSKENK